MKYLQVNRKVIKISEREEQKKRLLVKVCSSYLIRRLNLLSKYFSQLITQVTFEPSRALECRNYLKILQVENVSLQNPPKEVLTLPSTTTRKS